MALGYLTDALEIKRNNLSGDLIGQIQLYCIIGWIHYLANNSEQALTKLQECLARLELSDASHLSGTVRAIPARLIARVYESQGDYDNAYFCLQQSLDFEDQSSQPNLRMKATVLNNIGVILVLKESTQSCEEAIVSFEQALGIITKMKDNEKEKDIVMKNLAWAKDCFSS